MGSHRYKATVRKTVKSSFGLRSTTVIHTLTVAAPRESSARATIIHITHGTIIKFEQEN